MTHRRGSYTISACRCLPPHFLVSFHVDATHPFHFAPKLTNTAGTERTTNRRSSDGSSSSSSSMTASVLSVCLSSRVVRHYDPHDPWGFRPRFHRHTIRSRTLKVSSELFEDILQGNSGMWLLLLLSEYNCQQVSVFTINAFGCHIPSHLSYCFMIPSPIEKQTSNSPPPPQCVDIAPVWDKASKQFHGIINTGFLPLLSVIHPSSHSFIGQVAS